MPGECKPTTSSIARPGRPSGGRRPRGCGRRVRSSRRAPHSAHSPGQSGGTQGGGQVEHDGVAHHRLEVEQVALEAADLVLLLVSRSCARVGEQLLDVQLQRPDEGSRQRAHDASIGTSSSPLTSTPSTTDSSRRSSCDRRRPRGRRPVRPASRPGPAPGGRVLHRSRRAVPARGGRASTGWLRDAGHGAVARSQRLGGAELRKACQYSRSGTGGGPAGEFQAVGPDVETTRLRTGTRRASPGRRGAAVRARAAPSGPSPPSAACARGSCRSRRAGSRRTRRPRPGFARRRRPSAHRARPPGRRRSGRPRSR